MGHTVLAPDPHSEHIASPHDSALLLADLVRAVRLGDRVRLLEPTDSASSCAACMAAYAEAQDSVTAAGGVRQWVTQYEALLAASGCDRTGPLGLGMPVGETTMSGEFTQEEIRDAATLLANHYGRAVQNGELDFYKGSIQRLMQAVADKVVAQQYLTADLAQLAVPKAVGFVRSGGRW